MTVLSIRERAVDRSPYSSPTTGGKFDITNARKKGIPTRNTALKGHRTNLCISKKSSFRTVNDSEYFSDAHWPFHHKRNAALVLGHISCSISSAVPSVLNLWYTSSDTVGGNSPKIFRKPQSSPSILSHSPIFVSSGQMRCTTHLLRPHVSLYGHKLPVGTTHQFLHRYQAEQCKHNLALS